VTGSRSAASGSDVRARVRGCLLAGAVGDALGAPVEFWSRDEIHARLGPEGVTGYLPAYGREAGAITDDTQMTLFTAEGIIRATVRYAHRGIAHGPSVLQRAYVRWLATQGEAPLPPDGQNGWLVHVATSTTAARPAPPASPRCAAATSARSRSPRTTPRAAVA